MDDISDWEVYGAKVTAVYPSEPLIRFYMKYMTKFQDPQILELGFGGGRNTRFLAQQTANLTAIDCSKNSLQKASALIESFDLNATLKHTNVMEFNYNHETFDGIIDISTLQHLHRKDLNKVLEKIYFSLKKGGYFFSIFKNIDDYVFSKGSSIDSSAKVYDESFDKISNPCILNFLSKQDISEIFNTFKFVEINTDRWTYDNDNKLNSHWLITLRK